MADHRTGRRQAAYELQPLGLRVAARTKLSPDVQQALTSADTYCIVKLQQGKSDDRIGCGDIIATCPTLTAVVTWAQQEKSNGKNRDSYGPKAVVEAPKDAPPAPTGAPRSEGAPTDDPYNGSTSPFPKDAPEPAPTGDAPPPPAPGSLEAMLLAGLKPTLEAMVQQAKQDAAASQQAMEAASKAAIERANETMADIVEQKLAKAVERVARPLEVKIPTIPEPKIIDGAHKQFAVLLRIMGAGGSVFASGPSGSGKTTAMQHAADALGLAYFIQRPIQDSFDVSGFVDAHGNYQASAVYRWATTPGAILILDELDRSNPNALISLHTICNGKAVFPHEQVDVPEGNVVCATGNTWGVGPDAEYTGSARLDAATLNRFDARMVWEYDTALEKRMVLACGCSAEDFDVALKFRERLAERGIRLIWSPRDTVAFCKRITYADMSRAESASYSVLGTMREKDYAELTEGLLS